MRIAVLIRWVSAMKKQWKKVTHTLQRKQLAKENLKCDYMISQGGSRYKVQTVNTKE